MVERLRRAGIGLQRTVEGSIREELEREAGGSGLLGQLSRLAFPVGIGPQGVLVANGYDSVRISGSGELPEPGDGPVEAIDEDRLERWAGHAAHRHRARPGPPAELTGRTPTCWW